MPTSRSQLAGKIDLSTTAQLPIVPTVERMTSFFLNKVRGFFSCCVIEIYSFLDKSK